MYKILLAGAVISTLMVIQAKAEEKRVSNENATQTANKTPPTPTIENEQLKAAYEQAKKDFAAHKHSSSIVKVGVHDLPLVPQEATIEGFPAPLPVEEHDHEHISTYYDAVADAYAIESEHVHEAMIRAHHATEKHKIDNQVRDMRYQDKGLPQDDINLHNVGHKRDDKAVPFRSARYTPHNVNKDNQVLQNKRYAELKQEYDRLVMKHDFYEEIADFMNKPYTPATQQGVESTSTQQ